MMDRVIAMLKVKLFDEEHELDLEDALNEFLEDFRGEIKEIKYQVALAMNGNEMEYCYSALVFYEVKE